jgi:hypothetical protein
MGNGVQVNVLEVGTYRLRISTGRDLVLYYVLCALDIYCWAHSLK